MHTDSLPLSHPHTHTLSLSTSLSLDLSLSLALSLSLSPQPYANVMFDIIDTDRNGHITFNEFVDYFAANF